MLQVSLLVRRELIERARDFNIILDDVSITELSFGKEYTAAVEAKQVGMLHPTLSHFNQICIIIPFSRMIHLHFTLPHRLVPWSFADNFVFIGLPHACFMP
jgi:hypothetical protein